MKEDGKPKDRNCHVWLSRTLLNLDEAFGFSCEQLETAKDDFLDILHRSRVGKDVADDELPRVMWCNNAQDDRKKRLPHLFKADGFFMADTKRLVVSQKFHDLLAQFDMGDNALIELPFFESDGVTPRADDNGCIEKE